MTKWVYGFGDGRAEGRSEMRELLGGKGAGLAEMSNLGIAVPPGFTITTEVCTHYSGNDGAYPAELESQVDEAMAGIEGILDARFGDVEAPLLVSVRSGARASMPGMMDTVLNLGLNDETVRGLAEQSGDERFAQDSYRRFIQMYSAVVLGVDHHHFEDLLEDHKDNRGLEYDTELTADDWAAVVEIYKAKVQEDLGRPFPADPRDQLWGAIAAVFGSWMNQRAITYRRLHDIPADWGTAVNVQAMVFGNMGETSATGVAFSRNPSTGENAFYGEYLINAQGEDVVAGIRTPNPLSLAERQGNGIDTPSMEETMPIVYGELVEVRAKLERHFMDIQDMEFTVQQGKLWMLQTRAGKRTAPAALRIACDMVDEGLINETEALLRLDPAQLDQLLHPTLDPTAERQVLSRALPASPGAAAGAVVFTAEDAETWAERGEKVILVRVETSPEDIGGMHAAQGILTTRGGMTSHAAVVARGMGTPCVAGAGEISVDVAAKTMTAGGIVVGEGDIITLDGASGEVMLGEVATLQPKMTGEFGRVMEWADRARVLKIRTNAETPEDAETARGFGAEGIGLCRTEHMFFHPQRIIHMREMILAETEEQRRVALDKLLPYQRQDFVDLFTIMAGLPVTIRLLDPPLHEFLPHSEEDLADVAQAAGIEVGQVRTRAAQLFETNPMLGHRGCRIGISYPEIYEMQARAIFEAAVERTRAGDSVEPEIMIPLAATARELEILKDVIEAVAAEVQSDTGIDIDYLIGTMIELPRAALQAGAIAGVAEFFSFGTNDLTQTTFGLSRDDSGNFLEAYKDRGIFADDPFATLDTEGVGELIRIAVERGRATRSDIKLGICGEHGGDPASIHFCQLVGLDYVSCSPYRVPIARLAAAQAAIGEKRDGTA
jgi:pyruvate, orthophosphate dikinase